MHGKLKRGVSHRSLEKVMCPKSQNVRKRKRTMTSSQVFSLFINSRNGQQVGDSILSRECFELWVATRNKKVVHPEESFRRTLIAHIRGVYGRKPFTPQLEKSLLAILRKHSSRKGSKQDINPWEKCFPGNCHGIGKRGFNKFGFHEEKAKLNENEEPIPGTTRKLLKRHSSGVISVNSDQKEGLEVDQDQGPLSSIDAPIGFEQVRLLYQVANFGNALSEGCMKEVADTLTAKYTFEELCALVEKGKESGFDIISPACHFFLTRDFSLTDTEMLFPSPDQCQFEEGKPSGRALVNLKALEMVDEDPTARSILKRSFKNCHLYEVFESPLECLIIMPHMFISLETTGEAWVRAKWLKGDGKIGVFLLHLQKRNEDFVVATFQEQTDRFPHVANVRRIA